MRRYIVVAFREDEPDRQLELHHGTCVVGRTSEADLVLPHSTISRRHAAFHVEDEQVIVEDLGSTNGLFINGQQVKSSILQEGDFLSVGDYTVVLRVVADTQPARPPEGKTLCISAETARLRHEALLNQQPEHHAGALCKAALMLGERMKLEIFLQRAVALVMESLNARHGAIVLRQASEGQLEIAAEGGAKPGESNISRSLLDYVLRTNIALLTEDAGSDPRFSHSETLRYRRTGSAMCVPLRGTGDTTGVFYVDTAEERAAFAEEDLGFFTAMGHVVGLAIENRRFDERIAQQQRLAALGEAVAGISHDVRSLLTAIMGGAHLLGVAQQDGDPARMARACGIVCKSAEQIESYLTDLLAYARERQLNRFPVSLHDLVAAVIDVAASRAENAGVKLRFLGGGHERANIDETQMRRAIQNLVDNAIDACRERQGVITVSIGRQGNTHTIEVSDTGVGIAAENIPRLREPFFSTKGSAGTGLGLAIAYRVVEQHGGEIHVVSKENEGTRFTILLPIAATDAPDTSGEASSGPSIDSTFKKCPGCGTVWQTQECFLNDPSLRLVGYQVRFEELTAGLFQFVHGCGATLAAPVSDFRHLYGGRVFDARLTGSDACPGFCTKEAELGACSAECACAQIREVLQVVRNWPKDAG